ncbi:hypothetical protein ES708_34545 [subsurface metagenome]
MTDNTSVNENPSKTWGNICFNTKVEVKFPPNTPNAPPLNPIITDSKKNMDFNCFEIPPFTFKRAISLLLFS